MIIKKTKNQPLPPAEDPQSHSESSVTSEEWAASHPPQEPEPVEDPWDQLAYEAGMLQDRRNQDRRYGYRRAEEKNALSSAYQEADRIREEARSEGFAQGVREAHEQIDEIRIHLSTLLMGRDEALLSVVDDIGAMAIEVAKKIIKTEVSCDETLVLGLVKDSIQKVGRSAKTITIRVHPQEVLMVRNHLAKNPPVQVNAEIITLDDMNVEPGSCIIETNSGLIDASFKTQFEVLQGIFGIKEIQ